MRKIISASRRTDIPAHYLPWLIEGIKAGEAKVTLPGGKRVISVTLNPDDIHTIVFWSKDYGMFLEHASHFEPYHKYFLFTINDCPLWEPNVPPLETRLIQLRTLVKLFGADHTGWRFDPIVFWDGGQLDNLGSFERILDYAASLGLTSCRFSFATFYGKVLRRMRNYGLDIYDPPLRRKMDVAADMAAKAQERGIVMRSCCQPEFLVIDNVEASSCIDGRELARLKGEQCSVARDRSQREHCGCVKSTDIGSYWMKCPHGCRYCYANPGD